VAARRGVRDLALASWPGIDPAIQKDKQRAAERPLFLCASEGGMTTFARSPGAVPWQIQRVGPTKAAQSVTGGENSLPLFRRSQMPSVGEDLIASIDNLVESQKSLAKKLTKPAEDGTRFHSANEIPDANQTPAQLDSELTTIVQSIKGIAESDLTFVPLKYLRAALSSLQKIYQFYESAISSFSSDGVIRSIDSEHFSFTDDDGDTVSISTDLKNASDAAEELLSTWHFLRLAAKSPRINDFASF
jgi:hypothetical protein